MTTLALDELAQRINEEYRLARVGQLKNRVKMDHVLRCGDLLNEVAQRLPRGEYMNWIKKKCEFQHNIAYEYRGISSYPDRTLMLELNVESAMRVVRLRQDFGSDGDDIQPDLPDDAELTLDQLHELIRKELGLVANATGRTKMRHVVRCGELLNKAWEFFPNRGHGFVAWSKSTGVNHAHSKDYRAIAAHPDRNLMLRLNVVQAMKTIREERRRIKPSFENRLKLVREELLRDAVRPNGVIADVCDVDWRAVKSLRIELEASGEIKHFRGSGSGLPPEHRAKQVRELVDQRYSVSQISDKLKLHRQTVKKIISDNKIVLPMWARRTRSTFNVERVIEESINALQGIAQGLQLVDGEKLEIDEARAKELLTDADAALKPIKRVVQLLRGASSGETD